MNPRRLLSPGGKLAITLAGLLLCTACGTSRRQSTPPQPTLPPVGDRLRAVATTSLIADVVRRVGGERLDLATLMPIGTDPHTYVPTPADLATVYAARVLFANGAGFEASLQKVLHNADSDVLVVELAEGLELLPLSAGAPPDEAGAESVHGGLDPHVWFDVQNVIAWVSTIERTLSALDPTHADAYRANAAAFAAELQDLDSWIVGQLATIPPDRRQLVTSHPVFGYLAHRYGLRQLGAIYPVSPDSEPSSHELALLEDAIRRYGVPAVFTESSVNRKLAEQVARDTGVRLVQLYTESLGGPGSGVESYIELMRFDVGQIVDALR